MKRTTLAIDDVVLREVKLRAAKKGSSLQAEVNHLLRQALHAKPAKPFHWEPETFDLTPQPGVDICDRNSLFRAMEGK
ncbi:MAG: hypothetical protein EPN33_07675 [Acidobacteria bacterium]|nr:MAG: hypothetical protein EPN33_07675 [Acidobacteriota bacterium]